MFKNYVITAFRNLLRERVYSIINIVGLSMGLAACMVLFVWVQYHVSFDQFHEKADRIYRPIVHSETSGSNVTDHCGSPGIVTDLMLNEFPEIETRVRLFRPQESTKLRNGEQISVQRNVFYTDPTFFDIFSFPMKYGNAGQALSEPSSIVLSEEVALALFGDVNPVGQYVRFNAEGNAKVSGVLKTLPNNSHLQFAALLPFSKTWLTAYIDAHPFDSDFLSYILLRPGVNIDDLEKKLPGLFQRYYPDFVGKASIYFQALKDVHLHSGHITFNHMSWRSVDIMYVYLFSTIAFIILLIAGMNYINLATARGTRRAKEVGIRKAIGSTRKQIAGQFIGESLILTILATLVGYLLIEICMPLLNQLFGDELIFTPLLRLKLFGFMMLLALTVGLLTGWYPAFVLSTPNPQEILRSARNKSSQGFGLRRLLVIIQFCITMILIVMSFTIEKQLRWIQNRNLGFDKAQVVSIKMPGPVQADYKVVEQRLLQQSWIEGITAMGPFDFSGFQGKQILFEGQLPKDIWVVSVCGVDFNFADFCGLKILEGRDFSPKFETDKHGAYLINETLKKKLGWDNPIGKRFRIPDHLDEQGTVIGVVNDFNFRSLHEKVEGCALFVKPEVLNHMTIRARGDKIPDMLKLAESIWAEYAPDAVFQYQFLDDHYAYQYRSEEKTRNIINVFALWAIFVASIGLLGLISYSTEQRTKEIGLRKVLGASVGNIMLLISKEFFFLLGVAVLIAWPVAWMLSKEWLGSFAYRTQIPAWVYLLSWVITCFVTMLVMAGQVMKAACANPVEAFRSE